MNRQEFRRNNGDKIVRDSPKLYSKMQTKGVYGDSWKHVIEILWWFLKLTLATDIMCVYIHGNSTSNLIQNLFWGSKSDQICYHFENWTKIPTLPITMSLNTLVALFSSDLPKMTKGTDFIELNQLCPHKHWSKKASVSKHTYWEWIRLIQNMQNLK